MGRTDRPAGAQLHPRQQLSRAAGGRGEPPSPETVTPPPHTQNMTNQLVLIETPSASWQLDDATRAAGRRGLAEARATLRAARLRATVRETTESTSVHATAA